MSRRDWAASVLVSVIAAAALGLPSAARAEDTMTAGEFLAECDEVNPDCRNQFVAGLQAVNEGRLACPPRIDANAPISGWLAYMHRRVSEDPHLLNGDMDSLQLEAFEHLWPCPKK